jgi:phosphomannomutase
LLPVLAVLSLAKKGIVPLVQKLAQRFTASDRIKNFATDKSKAMIARAIESPVQFMRDLGYSSVLVDSVNTVDGFRISLDNGDIIHLRPSGNAPELRCYAESDSPDSAQLLVRKTLTRLQIAD